MDPQAPALIKEIKRRYSVTQTDLSVVLGITQPAVSEYEAGIVVKERYDIIKTLQDILAGKIVVLPAQDLKSARAEAHRLLDGSTGEKTSGDEPAKKRRDKTGAVSHLSTRRDSSKGTRGE